jgi:outer membrane immunogenic protein
MWLNRNNSREIPLGFRSWLEFGLSSHAIDLAWAYKLEFIVIKQFDRGVVMLRKIFIALAAILALSGTVLAADLPTTKGPPVYTPPPPVFTWTGPYIGAQAGYEWGTTDPILTTLAGAFVANVPSYNDSGFVGGAHAGYNYQINQIVLGIEGDIEGSSFSGTGSSFATAPSTFSYLSTRIPLQGSLRGRIGYAWDRVLVYATGGLALADIHTVFGSPGTAGFFTGFPGVAPIFVPPTPAGTDSFWSVRTGWTAGGGIEYAIDPNWSVRAEYRYTDYGHFYDTLVNTYPGLVARTHIYDNAVRAGFSYKFDMMQPIVSKY